MGLQALDVRPVLMPRLDCSTTHHQHTHALLRGRHARHESTQQAWRAQVIDLISLKPFDMATITASVRKTRRVIIVEECMKTGGIGASLSASINEALFDELDHQVRGYLGGGTSHQCHAAAQPGACTRCPVQLRVAVCADHDGCSARRWCA